MRTGPWPILIQSLNNVNIREMPGVEPRCHISLREIAAKRRAEMRLFKRRLV